MADTAVAPNYDLIIDRQHKRIMQLEADLVRYSDKIRLLKTRANDNHHAAVAAAVASDYARLHAAHVQALLSMNPPAAAAAAASAAAAPTATPPSPNPLHAAAAAAAAAVAGSPALPNSSSPNVIAMHAAALHAQHAAAAASASTTAASRPTTTPALPGSVAAGGGGGGVNPNPATGSPTPHNLASLNPAAAITPVPNVLPSSANPAQPNGRAHTGASPTLAIATGGATGEDDDRAGKTRYWTEMEHNQFLYAVKLFGPKNYVAISQFVGTRTPKQVRTHAQKYQMKLQREAKKRCAQAAAVAAVTDPRAAAAAAAAAAAMACGGADPHHRHHPQLAAFNALPVAGMPLGLPFHQFQPATVAAAAAAARESVHQQVHPTVTPMQIQSPVFAPTRPPTPVPTSVQKPVVPEPPALVQAKVETAVQTTDNDTQNQAPGEKNTEQRQSETDAAQSVSTCPSESAEEISTTDVAKTEPASVCDSGNGDSSWGVMGSSGASSSEGDDEDDEDDEDESPFRAMDGVIAASSLKKNSSLGNLADYDDFMRRITNDEPEHPAGAEEEMFKTTADLGMELLDDREDKKEQFETSLLADL